jgi:hypothetical protein
MDRCCTELNNPRLFPKAFFEQGALGSFGPLCEAITSWRVVRCEGSSNQLIQLMQLYRENLAKARPPPPPAFVCFVEFRCSADANKQRLRNIMQFNLTRETTSVTI